MRLKNATDSKPILQSSLMPNLGKKLCFRMISVLTLNNNPSTLLSVIKNWLLIKTKQHVAPSEVSEVYESHVTITGN